MPFSKTYYYPAAVLKRTAVFLLKPDFTHNANDIPTKQTNTQQTITFEAIRTGRRKQEKPVPEVTPGRAALCLERLKTP
jgi:hypothetical protein